MLSFFTLSAGVAAGSQYIPAGEAFTAASLWFCAYATDTVLASHGRETSISRRKEF